MGAEGQTLARIRELEKLYESGYRSNTVDVTIGKLVAMEAAALDREISDLQQKLHAFEAQYELSSAEFFRRFRAGAIGDSADMFEWSAYYQMWLSAQEKLKMLSAGPD